MTLTAVAVRTILTETGSSHLPWPWLVKDCYSGHWFAKNPTSMYELLIRLQRVRGATDKSTASVWLAVRGAPDDFGVDTSWSATFTEVQLGRFCELIAKDLQ